MGFALGFSSGELPFALDTCATSLSLLVFDVICSENFQNVYFYLPQTILALCVSFLGYQWLWVVITFASNYLV